MSRPLKVFLCHAHADANAVRALYDRLVADGVDAWLDKEKLIPGQDWEREIRKAVREADVVIVCLSKQFNQRGYRQKEVRIALDEADMMPEGEIFIIPARLEECENLESLRKWHWVDLYEKSGYEKLLRSLQFRAKKVGAELVPKKKLITGAFRRPIVKRQSNPEKAEQHKPKQGKPQAKEKKNLPPLTNIDASLRKKILRYAPFFLFVAIAFFVAFTLPSWFLQVNPSPQATSTETQKTISTATEKIIVEPSITPTPSKTALPENTPTKTLMPTATPLPEEILEIDPAGNEIPMRLVPAGEFLMGSDDDYIAKPAHQVYLDDFYIDQYEVSNKAYQACVTAGYCERPKRTHTLTQYGYYEDPKYGNYPVVNVTWDNASLYCKWVEKRLPSEAEWEKAARGTDGRLYPWGNNFDDARTNLTFGHFEPVDSFPDGKSVYGVFNMFGNSGEWVNDWYSFGYDLNSPQNNPQGPENGSDHVFRTEVYSDADTKIFTRDRGRDEAYGTNLDGSIWYIYSGFRCAKDAP